MQTTPQVNPSNPTQSPKFHVKIVYCGSWGYTSKFNQVKQAIQSHFPNATVEGEKTSSQPGAFEVFVENKLVFSKLQTKGFVQDFDKLIADIRQVVG